MTKLRFEELNLSQEILDAVKDMGFEEASPIQSESIPHILQGKDIIGQAQTGTGKTAAFAIPIIERIDESSKAIQAIILCPTRELVIQVSQEFRKLLKYKENIFVTPIYGGQPIDRQLSALKKGCQIIIGTPGRTIDHIKRGSIKMHQVQTVVLDEADEMLDMGFREDMELIIKDTPADRQTVLFSATMADDIMSLTKKYQKDPVIVNVTHKKLSKPNIQQVYFEIQEKNKPEALSRLLDIHNVKLALVFCNTKNQVDTLVDTLKTRGYFADALHGDMSQNHRDRVMNGFRNGTIEILVATDVAGRGIDVNDVEAVFNYDLPRDEEDYIHRIGRTGRAGKAGTAYTFIVGKQIYNLKRIERANGIQINRQKLPTIDELETTRLNTFATNIKECIDKGHLSKYVNQIEFLMGEDYTALDVAASLLKMSMEKENEGFDPNVNLDEPQKEERQRRSGGGGNFGDRSFGDRNRGGFGGGNSGGGRSFGDRNRGGFGGGRSEGNRSSFGGGTGGGGRSESNFGRSEGRREGSFGTRNNEAKREDNFVPKTDENYDKPKSRPFKASPRKDSDAPSFPDRNKRGDFNTSEKKEKVFFDRNKPPARKAKPTDSVKKYPKK